MPTSRNSKNRATTTRATTRALSASLGPANESEALRRELADQELASRQLLAEANVKWPSAVDSSGFFSSVNKWLAFLLLILVGAVSLGFVAHWNPVVTGIQAPGSGFSSSSSSVPLSACPPVPLLDEIKALENRVSDALRRPEIEMDILGYRIDSLEDRSEQPTLQIQKLWDHANGLRHRQEELEDEIETVTRIAAQQLATRQNPVRQINWLSFDLGARAILHQSSPAQYFLKAQPPSQPIEKRGWGLLGGLLTRRPPVVAQRPTPPVQLANINYGPNAALQPWKEHEPKYCTAGRQVQLAARLPRAITPTNLVLEYYLKDEVLAVGAAPKEVVLWIPVPNPAARAAVIRMITALHPDIMADQRSGTDRFPGMEEPLDPSWVPIGRWTYDVHALEIAQSFTVPVELGSLGIAVKETVIRVNSNWGNKATTCLVRARLHGTDRSGLVENLEAP